MGMRTLTMKEEKRLEIIQRVFRGELTMGKASLVLGVSERQCYRIKARVKQQGEREALVSGIRIDLFFSPIRLRKQKRGSNRSSRSKPGLVPSSRFKSTMGFHRKISFKPRPS
jgi:transposase-like protein